MSSKSEIVAYWNGFDTGSQQGFEAGKEYVTEVGSSKWQEVTVDPKGAGHTYRLRVPGGWLYRTVSYKYPELHRREENENKEFKEFLNEVDEDHGYKYGSKLALASLEIIAQTTVFVPDNV